MPKLHKRLFLVALLGATGCTSSREVHQWQSGLWYRSQTQAAAEPRDPDGNQARAVAEHIAKAEVESRQLLTELQAAQPVASSAATVNPARSKALSIAPAAFRRPTDGPVDNGVFSAGSDAVPIGVSPVPEVTINGATYLLKVNDNNKLGSHPAAAAQAALPRLNSAYQSVASQTEAIPSRPAALQDNSQPGSAQAGRSPSFQTASFQSSQGLSEQYPAAAVQQNVVPMNLPSVLAAIDGTHPIVGVARWRVQQAYAKLAQAEAMWLPSIQTGFSFHRHDGNYQASDGSIVDVNRNSFQYGLGAGATGAGTTMPRPGVVAQFHLADAIFQPKQAEKTAWARGHAASAALNQQLLDASIAYLNLVDAHQEVEIANSARGRFAELASLTDDFAETGQGLQADADRLQTELALAESRVLSAQERASVTSAQLAQAISLNGSPEIVPTDYSALALDLVEPDSDKGSLVATALGMRPELKESQALVASACEAFRREKYAAFVPSVLLGLSTGGFGGGLGNNLSNVDSRYDFDAVLSWEMRNLGFGEKAARREQTARVQQARFEKVRVMDEIASQVSQAHTQVNYRRQQITMTESAITKAEDSYRRNLERIREGQGLPIEVLQSIQALEAAQRAFLESVIDHNRAQLQLQWAMGFPVS